MRGQETPLKIVKVCPFGAFIADQTLTMLKTSSPMPDGPSREHREENAFLLGQTASAFEAIKRCLNPDGGCREAMGVIDFDLSEFIRQVNRVFPLKPTKSIKNDSRSCYRGS